MASQERRSQIVNIIGFTYESKQVLAECILCEYCPLYKEDLKSNGLITNLAKTTVIKSGENIPIEIVDCGAALSNPSLKPSLVLTGYGPHLYNATCTLKSAQ